MALENSKKWNDLHEDSRYWPEYPSERVVQWAMTELRPKNMVLDHGCGTGRHAMFLRDNGFEVYGCDVSENGLSVAKIRAEGLNMQIDFRSFDGITLPYANGTFDALLSYGVLYYLSVDAINLVVDEFKRVIKDGSNALVIVRSNKDSRNKNKPGRGDDNMVQTFFSHAMSRHLFRGFSEVRIDEQMQTYGKEVDHDLVIYLRK